MRKLAVTLTVASLILAGCNNANQQKETDKNNKLELTQEWDKVFPQSDNVNHCKVIFHNRYGI